MYKAVHIHKSTIEKKYHLFFLFIPIIIFALVLALLTTYLSRRLAPQKQNRTVLGEETSTLDK